MKLTWFGHSAFRVEFGNARILIDPFLTGNPTFKGDPEGGRGRRDACARDARAQRPPRRRGRDLQGERRACWSARPRSATWLEEQGVEKVNPGNHGGTVDCGGFTVSFVNALHSSS